MAGRVHILSFKENANSYPQYRNEVDCICGFHGKLARPELAVSQGIAHLQYNGVDISTPILKFRAGLPLSEDEQKEVQQALQQEKIDMENAQKPEQSKQEEKKQENSGSPGGGIRRFSA